MTVEKLIEILKKLPPNAQVAGHLHGNIKYIYHYNGGLINVVLLNDCHDGGSTKIYEE